MKIDQNVLHDDVLSAMQPQPLINLTLTLAGQGYLDDIDELAGLNKMSALNELLAGLTPLQIGERLLNGRSYTGDDFSVRHEYLLVDGDEFISMSESQAFRMIRTYRNVLADVISELAEVAPDELRRINDRVGGPLDELLNS